MKNALTRRLFVGAAAKSAAFLGFAACAVAMPVQAATRQPTMEDLVEFMRLEFAKRYPSAKIEPTWNEATPEDVARGSYACLIITAKQAGALAA